MLPPNRPRQELLSEQVKRIVKSDTFRRNDTAIRVLKYLVEHEDELIFLNSRQREGHIARDVFGKTHDEIGRLDNGDSTVRNAMDRLQGLLEKYYEIHPESPVVLYIPTRRERHFTVQCVVAPSATVVAELSVSEI